MSDLRRSGEGTAPSVGGPEHLWNNGLCYHCNAEPQHEGLAWGLKCLRESVEEAANHGYFGLGGAAAVLRVAKRLGMTREYSAIKLRYEKKLKRLRDRQRQPRSSRIFAGGKV